MSRSLGGRALNGRAIIRGIPRPAAASAGGVRGGGIIRFSARVLAAGWDPEYEAAALALLRLQQHGAAMRLGDGLYDGQPKARTFRGCRIAALAEALEDALMVVGRDTGAGVRHP